MNEPINLIVHHPNALEVASQARSWARDTIYSLEEQENDDILQIAYDALHLIDDLTDIILTIGGVLTDV